MVLFLDEALWQQKITAYLHDPPQKALLLGRGIGHEDISRELIKAALGKGQDGTAWKMSKIADHLASAADRIDFSRDVMMTWWKRPLLRHPLSGASFNLRDFSGIDVEEVNRHVLQTINNLCAHSGDDPEKKFLSLWRNFNEELKKDESISAEGEPEERIGATWDLLPADTRMPQHSIWQHNRIVSALSTALPNPALLVMSLGPVQSFISCARKMSDFWVGSWILSYLSWQGMKAISNSFGPDAILFPDLRGQPLVDHWLRENKGMDWIPEPGRKQLETPSLPNRWIAILPADIVPDIAQAAEESIREDLTNMSEAVRQHLASNVDLDDDQWRRQRDWLEIYWTSHVWPETADNPPPADFADSLNTLIGHDDKFTDALTAMKQAGRYRENMGDYYGRLYKLAERAHGSRKLLRDFPGGRDEEGYKCTLCGERELAIFDDYDSCNYREAKAAWEKIRESALDEGDIQDGGRERLCTVCLTKRLAPKHFLNEQFKIGRSFPSTSEIAATTFKVSVLNKAADSDDFRQKLSDFVESITDSNELESTSSYTPAVGRALNRLRDQDSSTDWRKFAGLDGEWLFEESYDEKDHAVSSSASKDLLKAAKKAGIGKPCPYYAIALLDGDEMGKWVSGEHEKFPRFEDQIHNDAIPKCREEFGDETLGQRSPQTPSLHSAMSAGLLGFALRIARHVVEKEHGGKLVYAGGDDVFMMASIDDTLRIIDSLQDAFHSPAWVSAHGKITLGKEVTEKIKSGTGGNSVYLGMGNATASAGIAIAHYKTPLTQVIQAAHEMEERAKDRLGRDAFSVAVLKRSGEINEAGARWHYNETQGERKRSITLVHDMIEKFSDPTGISPRVLNNLREEMHGLSYLPPEAWEQRLSYLLERACSKADKEERKQLAQTTACKLRMLLQHYMEILSDDAPDGQPKSKTERAWDETITLLSLATFISRHTKGQV